MTYYAEIKNNKVIRVIVATKKVIKTFDGEWIETKKDGSIRSNYAGVGYSYDKNKDVFIAPMPPTEFKDDNDIIKVKWKLNRKNKWVIV